ncbi:MAG: hypothetical protein NC299_16490 [Lachnospiraceae bacterium]|nr:hypothetical protein [Ruminococcus sp.]MCM1276935.1 hypothetical protein [Lachnospiraceae bacterium]
MRVFFVSFQKVIISRGFYICVIFTIVLLFCADIHTDYNTMNRYSVIRGLMDFSRGELAEEFEFCNISVVQNARSGWFMLFAPILSAFCFVPIITTERGENAVRFQISRASKLKYYVSEFFAGVISAGTAAALGYAVFAAVVSPLFPNVSEMSEFAKSMLEGTTFNFPKLLLGMWCFGAFWSVPALLLTSILRNKYLIMCIPFFLKYGLTQTYQKISQNIYAGEFPDQKTLKILNAVNPDGIIRNNEFNRVPVIILFTISTLILFAMYLIISMKRSDCGA